MMKRKVISVCLVFLILGFISPLNISYSQPPPPPTSGGESGTGGTTAQSNGAPIGGGLFILLGLGAIYGSKKVYDMRKKKIED